MTSGPEHLRKAERALREAEAATCTPARSDQLIRQAHAHTEIAKLMLDAAKVAGAQLGADTYQNEAGRERRRTLDAIAIAWITALAEDGAK